MTADKRRRRLPLALFSTALWLASSASYALVLERARIHESPSTVRIVFDVGERLDFTFSQHRRPARLLLEVKAASISSALMAQLQAAALVQSVSQLPSKRSNLRLEFLLAKSTPANVFQLPPAGKYNYRLVVDLKAQLAAAGGRSDRRSTKKRAAHKAKTIIVIDAGHGGRQAPGAVDAQGRPEKKVTLAIAKKLAALLNTYSNIKAVLTRDRDVGMSLKRRVGFAREQGAHFFVSVHADGSRDRRVKGASVFASSGTQGPTSEMAAQLARQANINPSLARDIIGKPAPVKQVLVSMATQANLAISLDLGTEVLASLDQMAKLRNKRVEQANFKVLTAPEIPSILVETGFISNKKESDLLHSAVYQQRLANKIANALVGFIRRQPSSVVQIASVKKRAPRPVDRYTVARGDTLFRIARIFNVSTKSIVRYNSLSRNGLIKPGEVLLIP